MLEHTKIFPSPPPNHPLRLAFIILVVFGILNLVMLSMKWPGSREFFNTTLLLESTRSMFMETTKNQQSQAFYRLAPSNLTTIKDVIGDWRYARRFTVTGNSTPSDATFMPIIVNSTTGEVAGFVYSAYAETREGPPRVKIISVVHNRTDPFHCLFHWPREQWQDKIRADPSNLILGNTSRWLWAINTFPLDSVFIQCPLPMNGANNVTSHIVWPMSVSVYPNNHESQLASLPGNNVYVIKEKDLIYKKETGVGSIQIKQNLAGCTTNLRMPYTEIEKYTSRPYNDVVEIIEYLEYLAASGGTYAPIYGMLYSKSVECVLQNYYALPETWAETGFQVEFLSMEDPFYRPRDPINRHPQLTMNDCLYRARALGYEFVINHDLDETCFPNFTLYNADAPEGAFVKLAHNLSASAPDKAGWNLGKKQFVLDVADGGSAEVVNQIRRKKIPHQTPEFGLKPMTPLRLRHARKTVFSKDIGDGKAPKALVKTEFSENLMTHYVGTLFANKTAANVPRLVGWCSHYRTDYRKNKPTMDDPLYKHAQVDTSSLVLEKIVYSRIMRVISKLRGKCNVTKALWDNDLI